MNELMIHVEKIVRPVRASEGRKLRMRQELLAHLQAAIEQEKDRKPADEATAIERAKLRLGRPAELTASLQRSVPVIERMLMFKIPMGRPLEQLERRLGRFPGKRGNMTLTHIAILSATAMLAAIPLLISICNATRSGPPAHGAVFFIAGSIGWWILLLASYRLAFSTADSDRRLNWPKALKTGTVIFLLQIGLALFSEYSIANRIASAREIATCGVLTLAILSATLAVARCISASRRPYDPWLNLPTAD